MKINYIKGDATLPIGEGHKVITHICNDKGGWGRGFVLAISQKWQLPEIQYRKWFAGKENFGLGEVQFVDVAPELTVANLIGQHGTKAKNGVLPIRYEAVKNGLKKVAIFAKSKAATAHMPRIGAGLAGGQWEEIEKIIMEELIKAGIAVTVYDLN
ncbi:MAG: Appr-1-p processing protein [Verrucomicrobia bacterium]|nr:Appr-1-p processing protein [Cytophagales bacterium]